MNTPQQEQEYLERNLKGFEGCKVLKKMVQEIVKRNNIDLIVECGFYKGGTTKQFASMVPIVVATEINKEFFDFGQSYIGAADNVVLIHNDTLNVLPQILSDTEFTSRKILFWLDDHWGTHCPLINELKLIAKYKLKPIIAIHDFVVPGHPELGYDEYNEQKLEFAWIEPELNNIYGEHNYNYYYNQSATGAMRGCIFIEPK